MALSPLFWMIALALLVATLTILVWPLLRRPRAAEAPEAQSAATAVFRDHKRQIEADFTAGTITIAERDTALADLTDRFGHELAQDAPPPHAGGERSRLVAALVLVACVPVIAGTLYFALGNPAAITAPPASAEPSLNDPQIIAMVDGLAQRLKANPEDGEGWVMLARSYRALGRMDASLLAYGEAAKRLPPSAPLYTDWAEAVVQSQGRSFEGQPTELLNRALALEPDYPKALALGGAAAMERNDPATASMLWTRFKALLPPGSPQIAQVDAALAKLGAPAAASVAAPPVAAKAATAPAAAKSAAAAVGAEAVQGRVELDPKLASKIAPGDAVFIFARDPDGPRMPLAAMKLTASELPKTFALTDAMAMSPANTISKAKKIVVEARVSKSGNVTPQPGDLAGTSAPVAPGASNVRVTIDRVVP
ncbi:MAG: c-type cytochrome biogenesis protein CcmI [Casimicrobiaceae bacterium]